MHGDQEQVRVAIVWYRYLVYGGGAEEGGDGGDESGGGGGGIGRVVGGGMWLTWPKIRPSTEPEEVEKRWIVAARAGRDIATLSMEWSSIAWAD